MGGKNVLVINKMWYISIRWNIYTTLKRNEILTYAVAWINLEDIMLSHHEARQSMASVVRFHFT